ncbi:MAG: hypothetical protein Q9219_002962 [cf. Caloplaca sp. 3 TL-2023]
MAAIDPSAEPEHTGAVNGDSTPRATLKLIYDRNGPVEDDDSEADGEDGEDTSDFLRAMLQGNDSEEDESSSDDEEINGGPSDPSKSKKARKQAAAEQLMKALAENEGEDELDVDGLNGVPSKKRNKGKGKAMSVEDEEDSEEDDESNLEEVVVCTLDPQKNYQQPLDLTIGEDQRAFFKVSGTHAIYLTGNYVVDSTPDHRHGDEDSEEGADDYDLSPDEDELDQEDESDELDDLEDPRITEVDTDEEEAPKLVKSDNAAEKGKNKRAAEDLEDEEDVNLDDIMAKSLKPEPEPAINGEKKLSKRQLKKLKNNAGKAVEAAVENKDVKKAEPATKDSPAAKSDKKVQFAKNLEQGPSSTPKDSKLNAKEGAKESEKQSKKESKKEPQKGSEAETNASKSSTKASLGPKTLQNGVKIDDRKLGKGPACKKGDKVAMRYIGKLMDNKVFDARTSTGTQAYTLILANKSGTPFTFTLGSGEVIKGWDIGVAGMSMGGERRIEVPANMAYGSKSMPGIPANSPLKFEVKLLRIR